MKKRLKIPWPAQWRRQTRLPASGNNLIYTPKDFIISFTLYIVTVIACMLLRFLDETEDTSYVAMLFLTDVFLTAVLTDGYLFSILCAILGVFSVDYIFTEPYWHISFTLAGFPLTFLVMMTISILAGALASRAKQMEATQRQMIREKMRGNLLRGMGHDIRTPLTGIIGATDVLLKQDETLTPQQRRELLQSINEEAKWLMRVSENLLSITRIDGENAGVKKTPELVEEGFVRELVSKLQPMRKEAGFEVMDTITVYADGNEKLQKLMEKNADSMLSDVMATALHTGTLAGYQKTWNVNGEEITLGVEKNA